VFAHGVTIGSVKTLNLQPNLVEQVRDALLEEIVSGQMAPGDRIIQEEVAQALGVSRQPVQQALLLLRNQGVLRDAPGRGLIVAPLDPEHVQHMYDMRAVLEGLACRLAAESAADQAARGGPALIEAGRKAIASGSIPRMIAADLKFHAFLYGLSGNPLVEGTLGTHLNFMHRVMGEVLTRDEKPRDIWDQHAEILDAVSAGDGPRAEALARAHIDQASGFMVARLRGRTAAVAAAVPATSRRS
jgi:DNA-binding GntR family transcriptional regulator